MRQTPLRLRQTVKLTLLRCEPRPVEHQDELRAGCGRGHPGIVLIHTRGFQLAIGIAAGGGSSSRWRQSMQR